MLPFRSGRAGIVGVATAFLLPGLLTCGLIAAEKKGAKPEAKSPTPVVIAPQKKLRPKPDEGIKDVPITQGHDAKGLILPDFDTQGHLRGRLEAGTTRRVDDQNIEFMAVKFITYVPATETPNLEINVDKALFNLKTQVMTSNVRSTVKRADFEVSGDSMRFEMLTRHSTLEGNVKMIVRGKMRTPGNEAE